MRCSQTLNQNRGKKQVGMVPRLSLKIVLNSRRRRKKKKKNGSV